MSGILYAEFESGYSCQVCETCCVGALPAKNPHDNIPWTIDWMKLSETRDDLQFCMSHQVIKVETVVTYVCPPECAPEITDCVAEVEYRGTNGVRRIDRRTLQGPVSKFRIGGKQPGTYRVFIHLIYGEGCEAYDWSGCWDMEIKQPC